MDIKTIFLTTIIAVFTASASFAQCPTKSTFQKKYYDNKATVDQNIETVKKTKSCSGCMLTNKEIYSLGVGNNFKNKSFKNSDLEMTNFSYLTLDGANFSSSDLSCAKFLSSSLKNVNFKKAQLPAAFLYSVKANGANFNKASLSRANLGESDFTNANFVGSFTVSADFKKSNIKNASFNDAYLQDVDFRNVKNIESASFSNADLSRAIVSSEEIKALLKQKGAKGADKIKVMK